MKAVRLSVKDMLIAIGLIGVLMGAFRFHLSIGSFLAGVVALAAKRATGRYREACHTNRTLADRGRLKVFGRSLWVAFLLLAASSLPTLALFVLHDTIPVVPNLFIQNAKGHGAQIGPPLPIELFLISIMAGISISMWMRRWLW